MFTPVILAIDEGTTNAKAIAVDERGRILAKAAVALQVTHPQPGRAEQDAMAIWHAVCQAAEACLSSLHRAQVVGVAISNQRESVLIWDRRTGKPLTPLVSWQDRRAEKFCQALQGSAEARLIESRTGLQVDPLFPAAKLHAMLAELPDGVVRAMQGNCASERWTAGLTGSLAADERIPPTIPTRRERSCLISTAAAGMRICWRCSVFPACACLPLRRPRRYMVTLA